MKMLSLQLKLKVKNLQFAGISEDLTEVLNAVEGLVIGVMVIIRLIKTRTADENNIIAFKFIIHILETHTHRIHIPAIINILKNTPMNAIIGNHQRQQISGSDVGIGNTGADGEEFAGNRKEDIPGL